MNPPPPANENDPAVHVRITQPPNLRQLFAILFFDPASLFMVPQKNWKRALALFLGIAFAGGVLIELSAIPRKMESAKEWAQFFGQNVERVQLRENSISWKKPSEVPHVFSFDEWHIKFAENGSEFDAGTLGTSRSKGVWITNNTIIQWWIPRGSNEAVHQVLYKEGQLFNKISALKLWPQGYTIQGKEFVTEATSILSKLIPFFLVSKGIGTMLQALFYTIVFAVIPYFMKSPIAGAGFTNLLALYLYIGIPPLIVATVYSILHLPFLDFGILYVGGFILYLMFIMWQYRKRQTENEDAAD